MKINAPLALWATLLTLLFINLALGQDEQKDWTAFSQGLEVGTKKKIKFKLTASVKVDATNPDGKAGLWARVDNEKKSNRGFFDNMHDRPITANTWTEYSIEGQITKKATYLIFGGLVYGNGAFLFDNFKLQIENPETGIFETIPLNNASFEKSLAENKIQGWGMPVPIGNNESVNGFTINLTDDAKDQNKAVAIIGEGVTKNQPNYIGPLEGYSPQIGSLITMLNNLKMRVAYTVGDLSQEELDYIMDKEANSIGALLAHLIATEKLFQIIIFEEREPNEEEMALLTDAMELGDLGRKHLKGKSVKQYLEEYSEVRKKTMELLKEKDDEWLLEIPEGSTLNNYYSWFHVMEHQSSHLGQILLLKKRIPENLDVKINSPKSVD